MRTGYKRMIYLLIYPLMIISLLGCTDPLGTGDTSRSMDELINSIDMDRLTREDRDWLSWFLDNYADRLQSNHQQYIMPLLDDLDTYIETYVEDSGNAGMFQSLAEYYKAVAELDAGGDMEDYYTPVADYAWEAHDMCNTLASAVRRNDRADFEKACVYANSSTEYWDYVQYFISLGD